MFSVNRQNLLSFFIAVSIGCTCVLIANRMMQTTEPKPEETVGNIKEIKTQQHLAPPESIDEEPNPPPKFCDDPAIKPIWNAIRRIKEVREALDDEISPSNCS